MPLDLCQSRALKMIRIFEYISFPNLLNISILRGQSSWMVSVYLEGVSTMIRPWIARKRISFNLV